MQIEKFSYRYEIEIDGNPTGTYFTKREEARAFKRGLQNLYESANITIRILQQKAAWGPSTVVS